MLDEREAKNRAINFFKQSYDTVEITNAQLEDNVWLIGVRLNFRYKKTVKIDAHTGNILAVI